jgi:glycosyltransferase involved in cell wall biosynthesis
MKRRILYLLSQRPGRTGSGVTLDTQVHFSAKLGWQAAVALGSPVSDPNPDIGRLESQSVYPLHFESEGLNFPVPGMSDVMPYPSTRFSEMSAEMLDVYRRAWREHLARVIDAFKPDLIHSHHLWLLSSMVKDIAPEIPQVIQCHATGLRQMALCPHLADEVKAGCARADAYQVLSAEHAMRLSEGLDVSLDRIHVISSSYREDHFHLTGRKGDDSRRIVYVGKLSRAKGLPWLLDAFDRLREEKRDLELHVAGGGGGSEAADIERRLRGMGGATYHGMLDQASLGALMRRSEILALPSFYEGVPLVLVEALACGCKLVATDLPGVRDRIAPTAGSAMTTLPLPRMLSIDEPMKEDLPEFVEKLGRALAHSLDAPAPEPRELGDFASETVFKKTEAIWNDLLN